MFMPMIILLGAFELKSTAQKLKGTAQNEYGHKNLEIVLFPNFKSSGMLQARLTHGSDAGSETLRCGFCVVANPHVLKNFSPVPDPLRFNVPGSTGDGGSPTESDGSGSGASNSASAGSAGSSGSMGSGPNRCFTLRPRP